jgi:hypothetical protein
MRRSRDARRRVVTAILQGRPPQAGALRLLEGALEALRAIPEREGKAQLEHGGRTLGLGLSYELGELQKDLLFLQQGEGALRRHFEQLHLGFGAELRQGMRRFAEWGFRHSPPATRSGAGRPFFDCFVTDRDGTVSNYCGRYLSSVQSAYSAVFLARFARRATRRAVVLTSAPLEEGGLLELSVAPESLFVYAGSKGREYRDRRGRRGRLPVEPEQQALLSELATRLQRLLREPPYELHRLIGSGFQRKLGQLTVARQDIYGSIPPEQSARFLDAVTQLVRALDPAGRRLRIEDTGKDVEIMLTVGGGQEAGAEGAAREFDKGEGLRFLDRELGLGLAHGRKLVCGDTASDLPMLRVAAQGGAQREDTWAVFVTTDPTLQAEVRALSPRSFCVSSPDLLVTLLAELAEGPV